MRNFYLFVFCTIAVIFYSCSEPIGETFEHTNIQDPLNPAFKIHDPKTFNVYIQENNSIRLTWSKLPDYASGLILSKSDNGTDFYDLKTFDNSETNYIDSTSPFSKNTKYGLRAFVNNESVDDTSNTIYSDLDFGSLQNFRNEFSEDTTSIMSTWNYQVNWDFIFVAFTYDIDFNLVALDTIFNAPVSYETFKFEPDFGYRDFTYRYYVSEYDLASLDYIFETGAGYASECCLPEIVDAEVHQNSVILVWEDNSSFEEGFRILRNNTNLIGSNFETIATVPANTTTYTDSNNPFGDMPCKNGKIEIAYGIQGFKGETASGNSGYRVSKPCN